MEKIIKFFKENFYINNSSELYYFLYYYLSENDKEKIKFLSYIFTWFLFSVLDTTSKIILNNYIWIKNKKIILNTDKIIKLKKIALDIYNFMNSYLIVKNKIWKD